MTAPGSIIGIYLLDDHEIVRRGLRDLFEAEDDLEIVGESGSEFARRRIGSPGHSERAEPTSGRCDQADARALLCSAGRQPWRAHGRELQRRIGKPHWVLHDGATTSGHGHRNADGHPPGGSHDR